MQAKEHKPQRLNPMDYASATDRFAAVVINQLAEERPGGKVFAKAIQHSADGAMVYTGLLHLGELVTKIGFVAEQGLLHGFIDEPGTAKAEREVFEAALAEAGLTLADAERARLEIQKQVRDAGAPRLINVAAADLEAALKCINSGLVGEGAAIIKRLMA